MNNQIFGMDTSTFLLVLSPLIAISLILALATIISIARKPLPWGQKWMWLPLAFVNIFGPIIYFMVGSRMLDERAGQNSGDERP